jgi:hypothetical protein
MDWRGIERSVLDCTIATVKSNLGEYAGPSSSGLAETRRREREREPRPPPPSGEPDERLHRDAHTFDDSHERFEILEERLLSCEMEIGEARDTNMRLRRLEEESQRHASLLSHLGREVSDVSDRVGMVLSRVKQCENDVNQQNVEFVTKHHYAEVQHNTAAELHSVNRTAGDCIKRSDRAVQLLAAFLDSLVSDDDAVENENENSRGGAGMSASSEVIQLLSSSRDETCNPLIKQFVRTGLQSIVAAEVNGAMQRAHQPTGHNNQTTDSASELMSVKEELKQLRSAVTGKAAAGGPAAPIGYGAESLEARVVSIEKEVENSNTRLNVAEITIQDLVESKNNTLTLIDDASRAMDRSLGERVGIAEQNMSRSLGALVKSVEIRTISTAASVKTLKHENNSLQKSLEALQEHLLEMQDGVSHNSDELSVQKKLFSDLKSSSSRSQHLTLGSDISQLSFSALLPSGSSSGKDMSMTNIFRHRLENTFSEDVSVTETGIGLGAKRAAAAPAKSVDRTVDTAAPVGRPRPSTEPEATQFRKKQETEGKKDKIKSIGAPLSPSTSRPEPPVYPGYKSHQAEAGDKGNATVPDLPTEFLSQSNSDDEKMTATPLARGAKPAGPGAGMPSSPRGPPRPAKPVVVPSMNIPPLPAAAATAAKERPPSRTVTRAMSWHEDSTQCTFCLRRISKADAKHHSSVCELRTELCRYLSNTMTFTLAIAIATTVLLPPNLFDLFILTSTCSTLYDFVGMVAEQRSWL